MADVSEGLSLASILAIVVVFAAFVWIAKMIYDLKKFLKEKEQNTLAEMTKMEEAAKAMEGNLGEMSKRIEEKVDKEYIDKRINELIGLVSRRR